MRGGMKLQGRKVGIAKPAPAPHTPAVASGTSVLPAHVLMPCLTPSSPASTRLPTGPGQPGMGCGVGGAVFCFTPRRQAGISHLPCSNQSPLLEAGLFGFSLALFWADFPEQLGVDSAHRQSALTFKSLMLGANISVFQPIPLPWACTPPPVPGPAPLAPPASCSLLPGKTQKPD